MAETSCKDCKVERGYRPLVDYVSLCPLHSAAADLLEACQSALSLLRNIGTGKWSDTPAGLKLREAIRQAGGG